MSDALLTYGRERRRRITWPRVPLVVACLAAGTLFYFRQPATRRAALAYHSWRARSLFQQCVTLDLPADRILYADQGITPQITPQVRVRLQHDPGKVFPIPAPPDPPPAVAPPPRTLLGLFHHLTEAGTRSSGAGMGFAAATLRAYVPDDTAVLFAGALDIRAPNASATTLIHLLTASPRELVFDTATSLTKSPQGDQHVLRFDPTTSSVSDFRLLIERRAPGDRLEWFAARRSTGNAMVVPYRLNGKPGRVDLEVDLDKDVNGKPRLDVRNVRVTHGWIADGVWFTGGRTVELAPVAAARKDVSIAAAENVLGLTFDPAGQVIAAVRLKGDSVGLHLHRIDPSTGASALQATAVLPQPTRWLPGFAFSADAGRLVYWAGGVAHVCDASTGAHVGQSNVADLQSQGGGFGDRTVTLGDGGRLIAAVSRSGGPHVGWTDVGARASAGDARAPAAIAPGGIVMSGDRTFLLYDRSVHLPHAAQHPHAVSEGIGRNFKALTSPVLAGPAAPDPSGKFLAIVAAADPPPPYAARLAIFDVDAQQVVLECYEQGRLAGVPVWSADGRRVAVDGITHVYALDLPARTLMRVEKTPQPTGGPASCHLALSPDGRTLAYNWIAEPQRISILPLPATPPPPPQRAASPTTSSTRSPS